MRLVTVAPGEALGGVLAHGHRLPDGRLGKGTVVGPDEARALRSAGIERVVVARLDEGDVGENAAAAALARAAAGERPDGVRLRDPFTGRCNLVAREAGLVLLDAPAIHRANGVHESLTLATLPPFRPVRRGGLVATAKVIPLAVPGRLLERAVAALEAPGPAVRVAPFRPSRAALLLTELPGIPEKLLRKGEEVTRRRLEALGSTLERVRRCAHEVEAVATALGELRGAYDLVLVLGASAVVDREDVVPRAVEVAGGRVERLGLPVDPGNLLLLARLDDVPVLGVPGCARSPRRNGFDRVLERVLAGRPPGDGDLAAMGVGGLLQEIPSRPQPRESPPPPEPSPTDGPDRVDRVAGLVLAAGRSERMGDENKLLAALDGVPLVARAVDAVLAAGLSPVVVVTGDDDGPVARALGDRPVRLVRNPDAAAGMSTSLGAGLAALGVGGGDGSEEDPPLPGGLRGVIVALGDMPLVSPATIRALAAAVDPGEGRSVCVPVHGDKRGNPVAWAAPLLPRLARLSGDVGGRTLLARYREEVCEVEVDDPGVLLDVDTPEALAELRRRS